MLHLRRKLTRQKQVHAIQSDFQSDRLMCQAQSLVVADAMRQVKNRVLQEDSVVLTAHKAFWKSTHLTLSLIKVPLFCSIKSSCLSRISCGVLVAVSDELALPPVLKCPRELVVISCLRWLDRNVTCMGMWGRQVSRCNALLCHVE